MFGRVLQRLSMPSMQHEILVEIFKNRPSLASEMLEESLEVAQPEYDEVRVESIELTEVQPAQYRADVVTVLYRDKQAVAVDIVDEKRAGFYVDILYNSINEAARRTLELKMEGYVYTSPFAVKHIQIGREQGLKEGHDKGSLHEAARSLLTVLRVRSIDLPEATRTRVLAEKNIERLELWLERAVTAQNLDEVFVEVK